MKNIDIQKATIQDLKAIAKFTDFWLAGRGLKVNADGAVNDYFISPSQHKKYITKYQTYIVHDNETLIAWAVIQNDGSLIHLLVAGTHRRQGIGRQLIEYLEPSQVHSKSNQSSGDPSKFYERLGFCYIKSVQSRSRLDIDKIKPNRPKIIDIYQKIA